MVSSLWGSTFFLRLIPVITQLGKDDLWVKTGWKAAGSGASSADLKQATPAAGLPPPNAYTRYKASSGIPHFHTSKQRDPQDAIHSLPITRWKTL